MNKPAQPFQVSTRLCADIPVAAVSRPKIPPLQGDGAGLHTTVPVLAISRPKVPPLAGD